MAKKEIGLLPITNDYVFKRVFSHEGNEDVLIDLLEAILERKINSVRVKNPEILSEKIDGKKFILDIVAELDDGTFVDIEMQTANERNIRERSTAYTSRIISEQLQAGEKYNNLSKAIFIGILNFEQYKRNSYHHIARLRFDKITEEYYIDMGYEVQDEIATDYIEMHYIELPKYFIRKPIIKTKLDEWLWLFSGDEEKMKMVEKKNKKIKKAVNTLERISLNPKERRMYEAIKTEEFLQRIGENNFRKEVLAEGREEGREEGRREGEKIGVDKEKKKIAKKMLEEEMEIETIEKITGLNADEINALKNET